MTKAASSCRRWTYMITGELKSQVDQIWNTMAAGGISNPLSVIEQLTYLLFIKRLDELQTLKENKANRIKKPIEEPIFSAKQDSLRWSRFKETDPEQMFETVRDEVFPFIKTLGKERRHRWRRRQHLHASHERCDVHDAKTECSGFCS